MGAWGHNWVPAKQGGTRTSSAHPNPLCLFRVAVNPIMQFGNIRSFPISAKTLVKIHGFLNSPRLNIAIGKTPRAQKLETPITCLFAISIAFGNARFLGRCHPLPILWGQWRDNYLAMSGFAKDPCSFAMRVTVETRCCAHFSKHIMFLIISSSNMHCL